MSVTVALPISPRTELGTRSSNRLRKQGLLPGIIYGHQHTPVPVSIPFKEFEAAIRVKHARTFQLELDGQKQIVLLKDLQWDYLGRTMLHVDLQLVDITEKIVVSVPVELRGTPKNPGEGVLDQPLHEINVQCAPNAIPDSIRIDIEGLTLQNPVHVSDLKVPEGVVIVDDPKAVVVHLVLAGAEPTSTEGAAEPVVLTEKKKDSAAAED